MIDTTALLLASVSAKYVMLVALSLVGVGSFVALHFSLKRNHKHAITT